MPQLIVNADDFGFSPATNAGIIEGHRNGIVTSTTVMINLDHAASGLEALMEQAPDMGIGLHINLSQGRAVANSASLGSLVDDDGYFLPVEDWLARAMEFSVDDFYAEISAQIERFISLTGRKPSHLDAHYHLAFLHPFALEATLKLSQEHGNLPMREVMNIALDNEALLDQTLRLLPSVDRDWLAGLLSMLKQILVESQPAPNMPAWLQTGFSGANLTLGDLLILLTTLDENRPTEIMCHPGQLDDPLNVNPRARAQELLLLTHSTTKEVIDRYNIELISFADLQPKE